MRRLSRSGGLIQLTVPKVRLATLESEHLPFVYALATSGMNLYRWRFRGAVPTRDEFTQSLSQDGAINMVGLTPEGRPIALAVAYSVDVRSGHCYVGIVVAEELLGQSVGTEVGTLFIQYLFDNLPLTKIYAEIPEFTLPSMVGRLEPVFALEACFKSHVFLMGQHWDVSVYATYRRAWIARIALDGRLSAASDDGKPARGVFVGASSSKGDLLR